jgi:hypothetical protein
MLAIVSAARSLAPDVRAVVRAGGEPAGARALGSGADATVSLADLVSAEIVDALLERAR